KNYFDQIFLGDFSNLFSGFLGTVLGFLRRLKRTKGGFGGLLARIGTPPSLEKDEVSLVHSDVHLGNFKVTKEGNVAILDRSLYLKLSQRDRQLFWDLIKDGSARGCLEIFLNYLSEMEENKKLRKKGTRDKLLKSLAKSLSGDGKNLEDLILDILVQLKRSNVNVPLRITLLVKNLQVLNKWTKKAGFESLQEALLYKPDAGKKASSGLIGKWRSLEEFNFTYDEKLKKYVAVFWAVNIETNEVKRIVLFARRAPPGTFEKCKRTGIPEIDKALEETLGLIPTENKFSGPPASEENRFILEPNPYGIGGFAVPRDHIIYGGPPACLGIVEPLKDNPIALFHEVAHASGINIVPHIKGGKGALEEYRNKEGCEYRKIVEMRDHYAYRLFQRQRWGEEDVRLTQEEIKKITPGTKAEVFIHPAYPETLDIDVQMVPERGEEFESADFLRPGSDDSREKMELEIKNRIRRENWWFQSSWAKRGLPGEQISISVGDHVVDVYNWNEPLSEEQISIMTDILHRFSVIAGGEAVKKCRYILIDNVPKINIKSGEELNGAGIPFGEGIILYPNALRPIQHRIKGVSNFEGTLIHELTHKLQEITTDAGMMLLNEWQKKFGWEKSASPIPLPGGLVADMKAADPSRCVSNYALLEPKEDLCESMVAAIKNPGVLDRERLEFLRGRLLKPLEDVSGKVALPVKHIQGEDVSLPKLQSPIRFKGRGESGLIVTLKELSKGSGLIGKWIITSEIVFVPDGKDSKTGVLQFRAVDIVHPNRKPIEIKIKAERASPELFDDFRRFGPDHKEMDDAL
ncbi:MAG: hypothetical protein ACE5JK_07550, partial [Candidatus Omnitrophota bacterium]